MQPVKENPTVDQDTGTQVLKLIEEIQQPTKTDDESSQPASDQLQDNDTLARDLKGTDRDETGKEETITTES